MMSVTMLDLTVLGPSCVLRKTTWHSKAGQTEQAQSACLSRKTDRLRIIMCALRPLGMLCLFC